MRASKMLRSRFFYPFTYAFLLFIFASAAFPDVYVNTLNYITITQWGILYAYPNGITADGFIGTNGAMAVGSTTFTSATRACKASDKNQPIVISQAGAAAAIGAPAQPTLQQFTPPVGTGPGATTYYVKITYYSTNLTTPTETLPSTEASLAVSAGNLLYINPPANLSGVDGYRVYVSNTAGGGSGAEVLQTFQSYTVSGFVQIGTPWEEPITGLAGAGSPPGADGTSFIPPLKTTVASCSGNNFTLNASNGSGNTVAGAQFFVGTDYSSTLNTLVANNPDTKIYFPKGIIGLDATTVNMSRVHLVGQGILADLNTQANSIKDGTTFALLSPTVTPFYAQSGVFMEGFNFLWPGQYGQTNAEPASPTLYPQLITDDGTHALSQFTFEHNVVMNAYDFLYTTPTLGTVNMRFSNNMIFSIHWDHYSDLVSDTTFINHSNYTPGAWTNNPVADPYMRKWSEEIGEWWHGETESVLPGGACGSNLNGNMQVSTVGIHSKNLMIHIIGQNFAENQFSSLTVGDVNELMHVDQSAGIGNVAFGTSELQTVGNKINGLSSWPSLLEYYGTCTGTGGGSLQFSGDQLVENGTLFTISGNNLQYFNVSANKAFAGSSAGASTQQYIAYINDSKTVATFGTNAFVSQTSGALYTGFYIVNASQVNITGNTINSAYYALDTSTMLPGTQVVFSDNQTLNTGATTSLNVPNIANILLGPNTFDKPSSPLVAIYTTAQTNSAVAIPPGMQTMEVDGCGPGGGGGAGVVAASASGGAGGAGGYCPPPRTFQMSDISTTKSGSLTAQSTITSGVTTTITVTSGACVGNTNGDAVYDLTANLPIGQQSTCSGTTLTLVAAAQNNGSSGDTLIIYPALFLNGGAVGTGGNGANGGAGTTLILSKNVNSPVTFNPQQYTGASDFTHAIMPFAGGGGGQQGQSAAASTGGQGGGSSAVGATGSSTNTSGCGAGGGTASSSTATQSPQCGAGGTGSANTSAGATGAANLSERGGAAGGSGGGVNAGTGQTGGGGGITVACPVAPSGNVALNTSGGAVTSPSYGYAPGCSGAGGGGASAGTAGNGSSGTGTAAGGGGGGSANTGGTAGTGGAGGPMYIRIKFRPS